MSLWKDSEIGGEKKTFQMCHFQKNLGGERYILNILGLFRNSREIANSFKCWTIEQCETFDLRDTFEITFSMLFLIQELRQKLLFRGGTRKIS